MAIAEIAEVAEDSQWVLEHTSNLGLVPMGSFVVPPPLSCFERYKLPQDLLPSLFFFFFNRTFSYKLFSDQCLK